MNEPNKLKFATWGLRPFSVDADDISEIVVSTGLHQDIRIVRKQHQSAAVRYGGDNFAVIDEFVRNGGKCRVLQYTVTEHDWTEVRAGKTEVANG